jgi:hypothetical protein
MVWLVVVLASFVVGCAVGRWWALIVPAASGVWIGVRTGVDEVPPWFLGLLYATVGIAGTATGVVVRRRFRAIV